MKNLYILVRRMIHLLFLTSLLMSGGCGQPVESGASVDELYTLFKDPPSEARPFVRWWWNGDCIEVDELERELDVMKAAGIGGVEIPLIRGRISFHSYTVYWVIQSSFDDT